MSGGRYGFHHGYWGPHIGYYGGVNYGGGYMGIGFAGGSWNGGVFAYNTAVVNVNRTVITNVYVNKTIVEQTTIINNNNVSYNGGPRGVQHLAAPRSRSPRTSSTRRPRPSRYSTGLLPRPNPATLPRTTAGIRRRWLRPSLWLRKFTLRRRASNLRRPDR